MATSHSQSVVSPSRTSSYSGATCVDKKFPSNLFRLLERVNASCRKKFDQRLVDFSSHLSSFLGSFRSFSQQGINEHLSSSIVEVADYYLDLKDIVSNHEDRLKSYEDRLESLEKMVVYHDWVSFIQGEVGHKVGKPPSVFYDTLEDEGNSARNDRHFNINASAWDFGTHKLLLNILTKYGLTKQDWEACSSYRKQGNAHIHSRDLQNLSTIDLERTFVADYNYLCSSTCVKEDDKTALQKLMGLFQKLSHINV